MPMRRTAGCFVISLYGSLITPAAMPMPEKVTRYKALRMWAHFTKSQILARLQNQQCLLQPKHILPLLRIYILGSPRSCQSLTVPTLHNHSNG